MLIECDRRRPRSIIDDSQTTRLQVDERLRDAASVRRHADPGDCVTVRERQNCYGYRLPGEIHSFAPRPLPADRVSRPAPSRALYHPATHQGLVQCYLIV